MELGAVMAETSWPDAAIAIAGVALVGSVICIVIWQLLATWRTKMAGSSDAAYRKLAEEAAAAQTRTAAGLEQIVAELRDLHERVSAAERVLKDVR